MPFPPNILVVDDDPAVCTLMQRTLEHSGYRVWTAHSGSEALDVLVRHGREFQLLVTDVLMPGMSGPTLAKAVRQSFPELPVLYVSGYLGGYADHVQSAAWLEKPFSAAELLERVQAAVTTAAQIALTH